jgi:hypothetical protein
MDAAHSEANDSTASAHASEIPEAAPQKAVADIEQKALEQKALEQKTVEQKSKPKLEVDAERIRTSIARLTSNSIGELEGLASAAQSSERLSNTVAAVRSTAKCSPTNDARLNGRPADQALLPRTCAYSQRGRHCRFSV